jgi:hypothetical protein
MKTIIVYSDPSHAWAKVKITELLDLNICHLISPYSYCKANKESYAYLEEDRDFRIYLEALKLKGIEYKCVEKWTNRRSKIRNYHSFNGQLIKDKVEEKIKFINEHIIMQRIG